MRLHLENFLNPRILRCSYKYLTNINCLWISRNKRIILQITCFEGIFCRLSFEQSLSMSHMPIMEGRQILYKTYFFFIFLPWVYIDINYSTRLHSTWSLRKSLENEALGFRLQLPSLFSQSDVNTATHNWDAVQCFQRPSASKDKN